MQRLKSAQIAQLRRNPPCQTDPAGQRLRSTEIQPLKLRTDRGQLDRN